MISCDGGRCALEGPLTLDNIVAVLDTAKRSLPASGDLTIDLAKVTDVDSSAVSLLLELRRSARRESRSLEFVNLPENLKSLAQLYGVTELLDGKA